MNLDTPSIVLLLIAVGCISYGIWEEMQRWYIRKKNMQARASQAFEQWMAITDQYADWRIKNKFQNFEHPHAQWFIRKELASYGSYLDLKQLRTKPEMDYLDELRHQVRDVTCYEPPKA